MRINHNIASMTTQGSLFKVNRDMSKSLERLSTGLRVNRASDDAAGLGVSENLRTQVRGTAQAMRNAQDGIAAITIAEGAANEISD
ncbi:MAG: flagellin, partial [Chitinispirillaceae bacterium]|nr:flagellin [Chitinispirillaceae bacterium]